MEKQHNEEQRHPRVALDQAAVEAYVEAYAAKLPDLDVWEADGVAYLVDGWHRVKVAQ